MAVGNTFGATALSSYGGFWIAFGIILTPGGFGVVNSLETAGKGSADMFYDSFGLFLMVSHTFNILSNEFSAQILPFPVQCSLPQKLAAWPNMPSRGFLSSPSFF
jgi:succinate-acetate transporter protein